MITDGVVTRTWRDSRDNLRHVDKDYRIDGDRLLVDRWTAHGPVDDTWTYTRVSDLLPIVGEWHTQLKGENNVGTWIDDRTVEVRVDGGFVYKSVAKYVGNQGPPFASYELTGTSWTLDESEHFLIVRGITVLRVHHGETRIHDYTLGPDEWVRFAYAPTYQADVFVFSGHWHESDSGGYREQELSYEDNFVDFGSYWLHLQKK